MKKDLLGNIDYTREELEAILATQCNSPCIVCAEAREAIEGELKKFPDVGMP